MGDPPIDLASGLGGRYRLERELGRGGMATVWLAHDLKHDRPVALKVLHSDLAATLGPERFLREIKFAARLQHPHIVSVYDSGETAGRLWFTMPYVEGESLRDRLRRGPLPVGQAVRLAYQVAQALRFAHEHGVLHRDVKPENILLTRDGSTLVADFGIARPLGADTPQQLTAAGIVVGTPSYMSPEQASGGDLDGRTDVYSLGCVLYEMLAGAPPFTGPTAQAVIAGHLAKDPPKLGGGQARVPRSLRRTVARALAKSPDQRFGSAADFAAALDVADGESSGGRMRWNRLATGAALGVAILALGYGVQRLAPMPRLVDGAGSGSVASGFNRTLSQLTFGAGPEEWPAWSPDGRQLAYVAEVDGYKQLFVRTVATGEERRVSREPRDHIQPAWSPDARRLVFARATRAGGKLEPNDLDGWYSEGGEIRAIELSTGREMLLVEDAFGASYSPDGTRLAFDAEWAGPRRIWVADARGRSPRQITADSSDAAAHVQPRWSPDGARLVFRRVEKTTSDIAVADIAGQAMIRVTADGVMDADPAWSPDGERLYFSSYRGGGVNVWRVPVDGTGRATGPPEQLTTGAGSDVQPAVAPDGKRLAFAVRGINADLWRLPVSPTTGRPTGEPEPVVVTTRVESRGAWSPDGRHLAFNSDRQGEMNIWIRSLADGSERRITSGSGGDYQPTWSPDGRRIVFFSARGGNTDIWTVQVDDGALSRLTDDPALDTNPFYSPDGQWIAFVSDRSGHSEVWLMGADGSGERQLASVGVWGHFLRWTGDSQGLVFRAEGHSPLRIFRASLADGSLVPLPEVASGGHMSFSPDGSIVLDVRDHKTLWAYPMSSRAAYRVFEFVDSDVRLDYPVWSPDGRWILFDRAAPRGGDLWALEGI
jgi:eukaryotic-like serine/threonine-protein kinase